MTRVSYLNGAFLPHENCLVHIEDRGFQFADGAYEVTLFKNKKLIDGDAHLERLFRSLRELKIEHNFAKDELVKIQLELFSRNKMEDGTCYINITRGQTTRTPWCPKGLTPTINATVSPAKKVSVEEFEQGFSAMTHDDIRWSRCDIKTVSLLASTLMNQKAKDAGFNDVIFVRDGFVTEASFANAFIVDAAGTLITRPADNFILQGITRNRLIDLAQKNGVKVSEKKFTREEMLAACEVFLTSSSLIIRPILKIDGRQIADGKTGEVARLLNGKYQEFVSK